MVSAGILSQQWTKISLWYQSGIVLKSALVSILIVSGWWIHVNPRDFNSLHKWMCVHMYLRVKLLSKDEVGWRAGDGDESSDGCSVGDAEWQAFTDHVISLGGILGVSPSLHSLHIGDFNGNLRESEKNVVYEWKMYLTLIDCNW